MFLKTVVAVILMLGAGLLASVPASSYEDTYLPFLHESGTVIGCTSNESFEMLLLHEPMLMIDGVCGAYSVSDSPTFLGWIFLDPPDYSNPDDEFIVARKYAMETDGGTVKFIWPTPLSMTDFAAFVPPYGFEEELDEGPSMDWYDESPLVFVDGPEVVYASLTQ